MTVSIILHMSNEEPIAGEMEEIPNPNDTILVVQNPRRRDGKDLHYLDNDVTTVVWPISRLNFLEILPTSAEEHVIGFVRE